MPTDFSGFVISSQVVFRTVMKPIPVFRSASNEMAAQIFIVDKNVNSGDCILNFKAPCKLPQDQAI